MTEHRDIAYGQRLPESLMRAVQEMLGSYVSANFQVTQPSTTTVKVPAGSDNDQVGIAINGKYRYNDADATASHPGGAAGSYDLYVTGSNNSFSGGEPETDSTVYAFGVAIRATGSPPATDLYRKVATVVWDGTQITGVLPLVGPGSSCPLGVGWIIDYEAVEGNAPSWAVPADGRYLDNATYPAHFAKVGTMYNNMGGLANPPSGKHRVIDLRGLGTIGKADMGAANGTTPSNVGLGVARTGVTTLGTVMGTEYHTLILAEMASHSHTGSTGAEAAHTHSGTTGAGSAHSHAAGSLTFTGSGGTTGAGSSHTHGIGSYAFTGSSATSGTESAGHSHSGSTGGQSVDHTHHFGYGPNGQNVGSGGDLNSSNSSDTFGTSNDHSHSFSTSSESATHTHSVTAAGTLAGTSGAEAAHTHSFTPAGTVGGTTATEAAHTHTFTTGAGSSHLHSIAAEGGGGAHENLHPVAVVNKMVSVL